MPMNYIYSIYSVWRKKSYPKSNLWYMLVYFQMYSRKHACVCMYTWGPWEKKEKNGGIKVDWTVLHICLYV